MTHLLHNRFVHALDRSLLYSSCFRCDNNVAVFVKFPYPLPSDVIPVRGKHDHLPMGSLQTCSSAVDYTAELNLCKSVLTMEAAESTKENVGLY